MIQFRVSEVDGERLIKEISKDKIHGVMFSMPRDKSSGPDGYTLEFLIEIWSIVKKDFVVAVQYFIFSMVSFEKE